MKHEKTVDYDNIAKEFAKSRKNMRWEEIDYFIETYLGDIEGKKVLDVGCGSGRLLEQFSLHFDTEKIEYTGVDMSAGMIKEAKKNFPKENFQVLDMLNLSELQTSPLAPLLRGEGKSGFDYIFFIASFHHLASLEERKKCLDGLQKISHPGTKLFFTNWALESEFNREKYAGKGILKSENEFGSKDFSIKIGKYKRFYHSFSIDELVFLFQESNFTVLENREFDTKKNLISVVEKSKLGK